MQSRHRRGVAVPWAAALFLIFTLRWPRSAPAPGLAPAWAEDTADLEALLSESVVTTASRSAERASVAPAAVFNITAAEILSSGARTIDEALEHLGLGLYIARPRDYATAMDIGAQGLMLRDAGRHVLVLLDGTILNSQGTGRIALSEAVGVPLEIVDHIEVMLGPGSVIYGSNAMLAVINIVTRRARDLPGLRLSAELGVAAPQDDGGGFGGGPGARPGLRLRLSLGAGGKFRLGRHSGEYTAMLEWVQEESQSYFVTPFTTGLPSNQSSLPGQQSWGGNATHALRAPSGVFTLRLGDFHLQVNAFNYFRTMPLVGTFNDPYAREQQNGVRLHLGHGIQLGARLRLDTRLYAGFVAFSERSNYGESFWCLPDQDNGCHYEQSARSAWVGLDQSLSVDWFKDGKLVTMLAYDARGRFFESRPGDYTDYRSGAVPTVVPLPKNQAQNFIGAIMAQQVWRPLSWLGLNLGARLDIDDEFGLKLSPRAAVVFTPGTTTTLRASYSEAFRAPTQYELTEFDPVYRITPATLRPETVRSAELELRQRILRLDLSLRGYAAFYDDLIESRPATEAEQLSFQGRLSPTVDPSVVIVNDNLTSLQSFGGSVVAQARLPYGLHLRGTFNLARTQQADGTEYQRLPLWYGNFRAGWQAHDDGYAVTLTGVFAAERLILNSANPTDFHLGPRVDLRLTAAGPVPRVRGLRFRAAVGLATNPELPYAITHETDTPRTYVLYPELPRLFGFIGLQYAPAGP